MATQHSMAKMGFWPFPEAHRETVAKLFGQGTGRVGDFQAGDGEMLEVLAKHTGLTPYANELDSLRAAQLYKKFPVGQVAEGDFFDLQVSANSFSLVFCNPPFQDGGGFLRTREELEFLEETWRTVQVGGYVVFVCYAQHMSEKVLRSMYIHSDIVETWQLPGRDLGHYLMLVTVCRKRESRYLSKATQEKILEEAERSAAAHQKVLRRLEVSEYPMIDEAGEGRYPLPEPAKVGKFTFVNTEFSASAAEALAELALPMFDLSVPTYRPLDEKQRSVIVPSKTHLFSLIAQGLANECVIQTDQGRAIMRSQTVRVPVVEDSVDDEEQEDEKGGTETITMRPQTQVRLLYASGHIEDITDPQKLADFVSKHSDQMMQAVADRIEPIYRFDFAGGVLQPWLDSLRLKNKRGTFELLPAQKHAVAALLSRLKEARGAIFAGDMGVGKTACGSAVLDGLRFGNEPVNRWFGEAMKPDDYAVIVAPGHLMGKWESELRSISPNAVICRVELGNKTNPQGLVNAFFRNWDAYPRDALKVILTTDTAIKSGEHPTVWRGAYEQLRSRGLGYHTDRGPRIYDPVSGLEIGVYESRRGRSALVPKKPSTLDKLPHFLHRDTHRCNIRHQARYEWPNVYELAKKRLAWNKYLKEDSERYERALRSEARLARMEHEQHYRLELNPLWQEVRGSSAPKVDVRKLLGGRVPLPDIVMAELEEKQYRAPANPRAMNGGIGRFLAKYAHKKYGKRLHTLVVDEAHEYAHDSARGETVLTLAMKARKVLLMTGSPFGGKASSVFRMEYMIDRDRMVRAGYTFDSEGQRRWAMAMGVYSKVVRREHVTRVAGRVVMSDKDMENVRERPGATPMLMRWQLEHQLTLTIEEIGAYLPEYRKQYREIPLPEAMRKVLSDAEQRISDYNEACARRRLPGLPITSQIVAFLTWLSYPFAEYPIEARHTRQDPITFEEVEAVELVHTMPALPASYITPKEMALLERIKANMEQGYGTGVYVRMTGAGKSGQKDVLGRLEALIKEHIPLAKVATLRAEKVARPKREAWLAERSDCDVLLCNPVTVRTGLDLYRFNELIALEWDYSLYTMIQASRRAWRIGQTKPCVFEVWAYEDTVEIAATSIMDAKWTAADFLAGRSFDVNAMAIDKNLIEALADAYERGAIQIKEDLFLGKQVKQKPKFDKVLSAAERSAQVKQDNARYGKPEVDMASKTMTYRLKDGRKVVWERLSETQVVRWSLSDRGERVYSVLYEG